MIRPGTIAGALWAAAAVGLSLWGAYLVQTFLDDAGGLRAKVVVGGVVAGLVLGVVLFLVVRRVAGSPGRARFATLLLLLLLAAPVASMFLWGRVTYARFGLTVYGIVPVPALDVTVRENGVLGLRRKSHRITEAEIRALLTPDTERIIIGIGWHGVARVEPAVLGIEGVKVWILRTPEAIRLYNEARAEGARVVLLLHSTC